MALDQMLDMANWTGLPSDDAFEGFKAAGVTAICPQAIDPPPGYPPGVTVPQCQRTLDHGFYLLVYLWLWLGIGDPIGDLRRKLDLIAGFSGKVVRLALDVEDNTVPAPDQGGDANRYLDLIEQALAVLQEYPTILGLPLIYSGAWYWLRWLANSWQFAGRFPAWPADYNGNVDDVNQFEWYGGWSTALYHQYAGTSTVAGTGNVDRNVIDATESSAMQGAKPTPQPEPTPNPLIVPFAHVADVVVADTLNAELARQTKSGAFASIRRNVVQAVVDQTQQIRTAALGPRPAATHTAHPMARWNSPAPASVAAPSLAGDRLYAVQAGDLSRQIEQFNQRMARRAPYRPAA